MSRITTGVDLLTGHSQKHKIVNSNGLQGAKDQIEEVITIKSQ